MGGRSPASHFKNYYVLRRTTSLTTRRDEVIPEGYIARFATRRRLRCRTASSRAFDADADASIRAYLDYLFTAICTADGSKFHRRSCARAHGSLSINDDDLMALPVPLPRRSPAEQQKIADCLTSLDECDRGAGAEGGGAGGSQDRG